MTTEETIDKARTAMRIMFEIAKETGLSVDAIVAETHTDSGEFTESFRIGDYQFHYDEQEGFMINYWPLPKGAVDEDASFENEWQQLEMQWHCIDTHVAAKAERGRDMPWKCGDALCWELHRMSIVKIAWIRNGSAEKSEYC